VVNLKTHQKRIESTVQDANGQYGNILSGNVDRIPSKETYQHMIDGLRAASVQYPHDDIAT